MALSSWGFLFISPSSISCSILLQYQWFYSNLLIRALSTKWQNIVVMCATNRVMRLWWEMRDKNQQNEGGIVPKPRGTAAGRYWLVWHFRPISFPGYKEFSLRPLKWTFWALSQGVINHVGDDWAHQRYDLEFLKEIQSVSAVMYRITMFYNINNSCIKHSV